MKKLALVMILLGIVAAQQEKSTPPSGFFQESAPTYFADVKPIIDRHCVGCHQAGRIGARVFDLTVPETVQEFAEDIALMTAIRAMPPWLPSEESPEFLHERKLTDAEIAILEQWHGAGALLGDPTTAAAPVEPIIPEIRHDVVGTVPAAYTPDNTFDDDYRCFLLDMRVDPGGFMTGYEIQPGNLTLVHHVLIYQLDSHLRRQAARKDEADEGLGWSCFGGSGVGDDDTIAAWAPGDVPQLMPMGTGFPISPSHFFVMQVHYSMEGGVEIAADQTQVAFQIERDAALKPLVMNALTAPVEIPCPSGIDTPECSRDYAYETVQKYYDYDAQVAGDYLLQECGKTLDDYMSQPADHVESSCDTIAPFDLTLVAVLPHLHTRGKSIRLDLNPDSDTPQVLIDIPQWDFHWQGSYQFAEPFQIKAGETVRLTCVWDNSQDENPHYIVWGEGTLDEMCLSFFTIYLGH